MDYDKRVSLPCDKGFQLNITDDSNGNNYSLNINDVLGHGGSCLVYQGSLGVLGKPKKVVVKEFYPKAFEDVLARDEKMNLTLTDETRSEEYENRLKKFCKGQAEHVLFSNDHSSQSLSSPFCSGNTSGGTFYSVSEFREGETLTDDIRERITLIEAFKLTASISYALYSIHSDHRKLYLDLKPSNVYVNGTQAYLFDFDTVEYCGKNRFEYCSYSKGWSAPEQKFNTARTGYQNYRKIGNHTDIFGVGAICFWLLTGKSPYDIGLDEIQKGMDWKKEITLKDETDALSDPDFIRQLNSELKMMLRPSAEKRAKDYGKSNAAETAMNVMNRLADFAQDAPNRKGHKETQNIVKKEGKALNKKLTLIIVILLVILCFRVQSK